MIKIVGLSGSWIKEGKTEAYLANALAHAREQKDVETERTITVWSRPGS